MSNDPRPKQPGEFELIERLTRGLPKGQGVIVGVGDDAAVVRPAEGMDLVITTDAFVAGVHFPRDFGHAPVSPRLAAAVGNRLAAANLSDLAAMAAIPRWGVLSMVTNARDSDWLEFVERSVAENLDRNGAALIGGNVARAGAPGSAGSSDSYTLTLIGEVERGGAWTRGGARPGDLLAVTGEPGLAGACERFSEKGEMVVGDIGMFGDWMSPPSRIGAARALARTGAVRAAIDISDGFTADLRHLCDSSGVGAEVAAVLPSRQIMTFAFREAGRRHLASKETSDWNSLAGILAVADELRFGPSDDYELLLAVDPAQREACEAAARETHTPLSFVGSFTANPGVLTLRRADGTSVPLPGKGYDHFAEG